MFEKAVDLLMSYLFFHNCILHCIVIHENYITCYTVIKSRSKTLSNLQMHICNTVCCKSVTLSGVKPILYLFLLDIIIPTMYTTMYHLFIYTYHHVLQIFCLYNLKLFVHNNIIYNANKKEVKPFFCFKNIITDEDLFETPIVWCRKQYQKGT